MTQQQFLNVVDRDTAQQRFHAAIGLDPLGVETVPLDEALGRVLAEDIAAQVDVPSFDRSNLDGYAVQAVDTYGATEHTPRRLTLLAESIPTAVVPHSSVQSGEAMSIATGAMVPRGADAIVMVEHTDLIGGELVLFKGVAPGHGIAFAGTDIAAGEIAVRRGERLTSRETGVLAAIGAQKIPVFVRPQVAVISTGNEIIPPGATMRPGRVYDSNARILCDAIREQGAVPSYLGIVHDHRAELNRVVRQAIEQYDVVLLSGGTSKGEGDLCYQVVRELDNPGIVAHGVALKPGKPICLAADRGKPVVVLPGFPTSAVFTFHEFVAPVIRRLAAIDAAPSETVQARLAVKINSEIGRTEYALVGLIRDPDRDPPLAAFPMGKGSGSVTAFSRADGFITIDRHHELLAAETVVPVRLLGHDLRPADLVVIGSQCVGLDELLSLITRQGYHVKFLAVGSTGGLQAAREGRCDIAGIHLLDPDSGQYNRPWMDDSLFLQPGYGRLQGILFRPNDERLAGKNRSQVLAAITTDATLVMVNRNQGSGTRVLIDRLLAGSQPAGYAIQARSHNAVAAAVAQGRADWGIAIERVARQQELGFLPVQHEQFDFAIPRSRLGRPAVMALQQLLADPSIRQRLKELGFEA